MLAKAWSGQAFRACVSPPRTILHMRRTSRADPYRHPCSKQCGLFFLALLYWLVGFHDRLGLTNSSWPASFNISHGEYSTNTRAPRRSPHTFVIDLHIWVRGWVTIYVASLTSPPRYIIYHVPLQFLIFSFLPPDFSTTAQIAIPSTRRPAIEVRR
jgi:hypothetical protein